MRAIQEVVDDLADRIGQPVGVDDRRYRSLAYSAHSGELDEVRRASIVCREAPAEACAHLDTLGLDHATGPVRVPARLDLGMEARVCVPIRCGGILIGFLWLFDRAEAHTAQTREAVASCIEELGAALYRNHRLANAERSREAELVDALVRSTRDVDLAAHDLHAAGLATASRYVVMVGVSGPAAEAIGPSEREVGFGIAVERLRRGMRPRQIAAAVTAHDLVVVVGLEGEDLTRWATALRAAVAEHVTGNEDGTGVLIGVGAPRGSLAEMREAYREAVASARVAETVETMGALALWDRLGAYRVVAELLGERDPLAMLPRALRRLLDDPDAQTLVRTLDSYLEHAGDAQASAADLYIHRSSLYNRLHRIEQVCGIDLRNGDDRLEVHLGLRLWKLVRGARAGTLGGAAPRPVGVAR
jgi:sugar diacid utilization regulator